MYILGISAYYHDSAAALIKDGDILSAVQEERFTRIKHDNSFPQNSILYCLNQAKISADELDYIIYYEKPFLKFERLLETYFSFAPKGILSFISAMPIWVKEKIFQKMHLIRELKKIFPGEFNWENKLLFSEHHLSHAASAFYPSPFDRAAVLTMDGVGEYTTTSLCIGNGSNLNVHKEIHFPHSIGLLYSAFTFYCGFKVNSGEYKLMGLAPYGSPKYVDLIKSTLIDIKEDGSFHLNMKYFDYATGLRMTNQRFNKLFDGPPRKTEDELTQKYMDIAASIQKVTEEVVLKLARNIAKDTNEKNLCLAGGVALNCVANGVLQRAGLFKNIWIQPAAGDAGGSIGAALVAYYIYKNKKRVIPPNQNDNMKGSYLGPKYCSSEIKKALNSFDAIYSEMSEEEIIEYTASKLSQGKIVGWMQGRCEFGPRALGNRSILGDPRNPNMQKNLNLKIKYRESFRPFAPSILEEEVNQWFDTKNKNPYMLFVSLLLKNKRYDLSKFDKIPNGLEKLHLVRSDIPSVTHVDFSARVQTVSRNINEKFYMLIDSFKKKTNCPMLINTSFNIRGEPIVCSPEDAFRCFMATELDLLVIDNFILKKKDQNQYNKKDFLSKYLLD
jgi:carbamoyltransferase